MRITHEQHEQAMVIRLTGDFNVDAVEPFTRIVGEQLRRSRDFILDFGHVEFIDSRGLETLLWLQDQAAEQLGQLCLVGATENVRTVLRVTRLESRFQVHAELREALRAMR